MTDSSTPGEGQPRQINLQDLVNQFMGGLQRHFDMLAFNLSSRERAREEDYDRHSKAVHIMPASKVHQNFEQMQAYARDLLIRQVIGDAMNLAVTCMNNAHLFLSLVKASRDYPGQQTEIQKKAQERQQSFVHAPLDDKFDRLEKEYDIRCGLEDTLTSLGFIAQNFMRQRNKISAGQTDDNGELIVELRAVDPSTVIDPEHPPVVPRMIEIPKVFREGDAVYFDDRELQLILVTIGAFAQDLFSSVARFAKSTREG